MKPPSFWYHPPASLGNHLLAAITRPLGPVYAGQVARHLRRTTPTPVEAAVVCVGNLTLGGTGKTPVSIAILEALKSRGLEAHALSRGYGGKEKGPLRVDPVNHTAIDVGDEPLLLAEAAPAWVSRNRVEGARAATRDGASAIIMDDGYQNPQLHKDLSLVLVDVEVGWGNGRVFPAGPLREPVAAGLARADAVVVMLKDANDHPDYTALGFADLQIPVLAAWLEPQSPPPAEPLFAFAGIGRPEKFFNTLAEAGGQLTGTRAFPDHHQYTKFTIESLRKAARKAGARLITTEKDWGRLSPEDRVDVLPWPVKANFAEPARLQALLDQALDAADARR